MSVRTERNAIFTLDMDIKDPVQSRLFSLVKEPLEHVLAFPRLKSAYAEIAQMKDERPFPDKVLALLEITPGIDDADLARLQAAKGAVIVVANHPFGGIEGLILASVLRSVRPDVKFMANSLLHRIPEMRNLLISVNPFKKRSAVRENIAPLRESMHWVRSGGMLVVFPAGEVSHLDLRRGTVTDPPWNPSIARVIKRTGASVLPLYFPGSNSPAFHMAGMVHPLLRTALLPKELLNKKRNTIAMRIGDLVPCEKLRTIERDEEMMEHLRMRTYLLEHREPASGCARSASSRKKQTTCARLVIPPQPMQILSQEISRLAPSQVLVESGDHVVIQATADQIPHLLIEIGRLREITFRAVGEGTGNAVDLDGFDQTYTHLFIWNRSRQEVVGAYRLGPADDLVRKQGVRGLYTSTLFHYDIRFLKQLGPALELGRSFIQPDYQRSYAPLLQLWKGIGRFLVENPRYRVLFGPVSITNDYQALSRELIVRFLKSSCYRHDMAGLVTPRKPLKKKTVKAWDLDAALRPAGGNMDELSELVSSIESDKKGIPVLLRQYLKLGGEIIGFNVDPSFGNVLDGLIMVDLVKTDPKMVERYLGKEGARSYLGYHSSILSEAHEQAAS